VIGHFEVGTSGKADIHLKPDANQFVVIEAKIHSLLSAGTRNAPGYDQAARSVACIAEVLSRAEQHPREIESLAFIVTAPQADIDRNQIAAKLEKSSIEAAVRSRAQAFSPELDAWLEQWLLPTLERIIIASLSGESLISEIQGLDKSTGQDLDTFYAKCLEYN
jgi:hypothetical protein